VIGVVGVGCDNVDLIGATRQGVVVANGPGSNAEAVAEFTVLLILTLSRQIIPAQAAIRAKQWVLAEQFTGLELKGAVLGLIGVGHIGRRVAELATCFGMKVFAYDPYVSQRTVDGLAITLTDLDTVITHADAISIHVPLSAETRGLIGEKEIERMKPGAILVNTARAPVIDEEALYQALHSGRLSAAATDVFPQEPPDLSHPLYDLPNFLATPHIGAMTWGALKEMQLEAARAIVAVLRGERPRSVVNREMLKGGGERFTG